MSGIPHITASMATWLNAIQKRGEWPAAEINAVTYRALKRRALIDDCARMYFGPRTHRVKVTELGVRALAQHLES